MALEVQLAETPLAWELDSHTDMCEALAELSTHGFRGQVSVALPNPTAETPVWELKVNRENDPEGVQAEVIARVGHRLLLANGTLRRLTADELAAVLA